MKKLFILAAILFFSVAFTQTQAQIRLSFGVNLNNQPAWGPIGYDHVDYYYLPDIDAYYNVPQKQFIYRDRNRWIFSSNLPSRYGDYNLYNGYKVVVNEPRPYLRADEFRSRYSQFKGNRDQEMIRDTRDEKYKDHPGNKFHQDNGNGRNRGRGNGRD